jgi:hypothetical protein
MSQCHFNLAADYTALREFISANPALMFTYVLAQILSQYALSKAAVASLNLVQRLVLTVVLTLVLFATRSFMQW